MLSGLSSSAQNSQTRCWLFERGQCRRGRTCRFIHVLDTSSHFHGQHEGLSVREPPPEPGSSTPVKPCRHFLRTGWCAFGSSCRFSHSPSQSVTAEVSSSADDDKDVREDTKTSDAETGEHADGGDQEKTQAGGKVQKPCRYFRRGRCHFGDRCRQLHIARGTSVTSGGQQQDGVKHVSGAQRTQKVGRGEGKENTGSENATGEQSTEERSEGIVKPNNGVEQEDGLSNLDKKRTTEISQLRRRYPRAVTSETEDGRTSLKFVFEPSDPDWPYDIKQMNISVSFPRLYPAEKMEVCLMDNERIPSTVETLVTESLQTWVNERCTKQGKTPGSDCELMFRPVMHWFDRNVEDLFTEALKEYKRELMCKTAGVEFIPASKLRERYPQAGQSSPTDEQSMEPPEKSTDPTLDGGTEKPEGPLEDGETAAGSPSAEEAGPDLDGDGTTEGEGNGKAGMDAEGNGGIGLSDVVLAGAKSGGQQSSRKGTEVSLVRLQLCEGAATLVAARLTLVVACTRCTSRADAELTAGKLYTVTCCKCHNSQLIQFNADIAHTMSAVVGFLNMTGCQPVDLVLSTSKFLVGCLGCSKDAAIDSLAAGQPNSTWCQHCHQKLTVCADSARFTHLSPVTLDATKATKLETSKVIRAVRDPAIQEGRPLPNNGTCRHYKKSFRWLRFPCCGKAYPCDRCHDDAEKDHEMKYANRMICGFCAREQSYAAERPCSGCQSTMTNKSTDHWEGGKGCRDTVKMNRLDSKKYVSSSKTVSRAAAAAAGDQKQKKTTKLRHI